MPAGKPERIFIFLRQRKRSRETTVYHTNFQFHVQSSPPFLQYLCREAICHQSYHYSHLTITTTISLIITTATTSPSSPPHRECHRHRHCHTSDFLKTISRQKMTEKMEKLQNGSLTYDHTTPSTTPPSLLCSITACKYKCMSEIVRYVVQ